MAKDKAARKRGMRENATLIRRFLPYFRPYSRTLALDLFFAALTTLCDLALPLIVRYFTGSAETLTIRPVLLLGGAYILLRVIDAASQLLYAVHRPRHGSRIETDMRRDMFAIWSACPIPIMTTPRSARSCRASPPTCST